MPQILVSYRREDSAAHAGRLADRLRDHFGGEHVFIDVDAIRAGDDFVHAIEASVKSCDVVVAVIGPEWATATDAGGRRRLDRTDDFVRLEIATALQRGIRVVPALVGGAAMPEARQLPEDLAPLARRQALEVSDDAFHQDVDRLIRAISGGRRGKKGFRVTRRALLVGVSALACAAALMLVGPRLWSALTGRVAGPPAPVIVEQASALQPQAIDMGSTYQKTLGPNEEAYFRSSSRGQAFRLFLDARCAPRQPCVLSSTLSILDGEGAVIQSNAVVVSTYDVGYRVIRALTLPRADTPQLKLVNGGGGPADYWVTLTEPSAAGSPRMYGEFTPVRIAPGAEQSGTLDGGAAAAYEVVLAPGEYAVTLDLSVAPRPPTILRGYVAMVDSAGGDEKVLALLSDYSASLRRTEAVSVAVERAHLFRIQNTTDGAVNYRFKVARK